jgi:DNA-binding NtrC family response regulator
MTIPTVPRKHRRLMSAINSLLTVLSAPGNEGQLLASSIEDAAAGLGIGVAALLLVPDPAARPVNVLFSRGLTNLQVQSLTRGDDVDAIQTGLIRATIERRSMQLDQVADIAATPGTGRCGIVCVPLLEAGTGTVIAVLYLQERGSPQSIGADGDAEWIEGYAAAMSRLFAHYFQRLRGEQALASFTRRPRPAHAPELLGDSAQTHALLRDLHETYIPAVDAVDPEPVLVLGERGTGKDLIARYLHAYSGRRHRPFVAVNCAEITDELAASRLFGHKRGSFTGAVADELGLFRAAHTGVLFLDEIAELSLKAQSTLLRVLENRTVVPVGETREVPVNVQVVLATNRDLDQAMASGEIRRDLVDRFRTQAIRIDPVRDRPADIPSLVRHFVAHHTQRMSKTTLGIDNEALRVMVAYPWPGNVREVARVCALLVTHLKPGAPLDRALLARCYPQLMNHTMNPKSSPVLFEDLTLRDALRMMQREVVLARLQRHNWNVRSTRESLGLPKTTFHRYAMTLGIAVHEQRALSRGMLTSA